MLLSSGYEFTFGGAQRALPEGKSGRIVGRATIEADVAAATAKADGVFRVWSTNMADPAAFPMFKGGYPLTAAGRAGLAQWNPRDNSLLRCGTKGTPLIMISPLPMEFVRDGDKIILRLEEYDTVRTIHMNPNAAPPAGNTLLGFSRGRLEGNVLVVETDPSRPGIRPRRHANERRDQDRRAIHAERGLHAARLQADDHGPVNFERPFDLTRYYLWKPENTVHPYECLDRF